MGYDWCEAGWRRQILRGPLERQGDGLEQSDPRVEAGRPFPDRSKERRETGARGHQGRVLVKASRRSGQAVESRTESPTRKLARGAPLLRHGGQRGLLYHPSAQATGNRTFPERAATRV